MKRSRSDVEVHESSAYVREFVTARLAKGYTISKLFAEFQMDRGWLEDHVSENIETLEPDRIATVIELWTQHSRETQEAKELALAAVRGDVDVLRQLLESGIAWYAEDENGVTAGEYALQKGQRAAFDVLVEAGVQNVVEERGPHLQRDDWNQVK